MEEKIQKFLETLEKRWKKRLERFSAFGDSTVYAYHYLVAEAQKFSAGELQGEDLTKAVDAFVDNLYNMLTIENAEWLKAKIGEYLLHFGSGDTRIFLLTASELVVETEESRHTKEWVGKAEKALENLRQLRLFDDLESALKPFDGREDAYILEARALIDPATQITKSWPDKARKTLELLKENKPRDITREAMLLQARLTPELGEKIIMNDNRQVFYDARELLAGFEPTPEWVGKATAALIEVQIEKVSLTAGKALSWWEKYLPKEVDQKPVDRLAALATAECNMLWVIEVREALKDLKNFKPTCSEPNCTKPVGRKDGGNGGYFAKCSDHGKHVETVGDLTASVPEADLKKLKAFFELGEEPDRSDKVGGKKRKTKKEGKSREEQEERENV